MGEEGKRGERIYLAELPIKRRTYNTLLYRYARLAGGPYIGIDSAPSGRGEKARAAGRGRPGGEHRGEIVSRDYCARVCLKLIYLERERLTRDLIGNTSYLSGGLGIAIFTCPSTLRP